MEENKTSVGLYVDVKAARPSEVLIAQSDASESDPTDVITGAVQHLMRNLAPILVNMEHDAEEHKTRECGKCETAAMALKAYTEDMRRALAEFLNHLKYNTLIAFELKGGATGAQIVENYIRETLKPERFEDFADNIPDSLT